MAPVSRERRRAVVLLVFLALVLLAIATYVLEGPREMNDLEVFHRAGVRFLRGEPLYRAADGHFEMKYLPVSAALFVPLSLLPLGMAKVVWLAVSCLSLSLAFALAAELLHERLPWWGPLAALLVLARSIERELANGQINATLLLLVVAAFVQLERRRDVCAGALIAVAVLLKPPWLVLLPYLLVSRRGRAATTLVALFLLGNAVPTLRYGLGGALELHAAMNARLAASTARLLTYPTNVSLPGALAKLTEARGSVVVLAAALLLVLPCAAFAWRLWRERGRRDRVAEDLAVVAPLAILLSPQAWDYTVLTILPTLLVAATASGRAPRPLRAATWFFSLVISLDYFVLFGRGPTYESVMRWSPNTWCLLWMLGVALALRLTGHGALAHGPTKATRRDSAARRSAADPSIPSDPSRRPRRASAADGAWARGPRRPRRSAPARPRALPGSPSRS